MIFKDFFILSKNDKLCQEAAAETGQNALLLRAVFLMGKTARSSITICHG